MILDPVREELFQKEFYKDLIIDPSVELPPDFPDMKKYMKHLGEGPLAFFDHHFTFDVLYPGGKVTYCPYKETGPLLIDSIIIYGVTTEPGVRAYGTSKFDTHIHFDLEVSSQFNTTLEEADYYFNFEHNEEEITEDTVSERLKVTVKTIEGTNIKDWWRK